MGNVGVPPVLFFFWCICFEGTNAGIAVRCFKCIISGIALIQRRTGAAEKVQSSVLFSVPELDQDTHTPNRQAGKQQALPPQGSSEEKKGYFLHKPSGGSIYTGLSMALSPSLVLYLYFCLSTSACLPLILNGSLFKL